MKKAFTMLELIFVIVILGILASIGTVKLFSVMQSKAVSKYNDEYMMVVSAINNEFSKTISKGQFVYPTSLEKLDKSGKKINKDFIFDAVVPKYKIRATNDKNATKKGTWYYKDKKNVNEYIYYVNQSIFMELEYDPKVGSLRCTDFECKDCSPKDKEMLLDGIKGGCPRSSSSSASN